jgi:hypothetical protein
MQLKALARARRCAVKTTALAVPQESRNGALPFAQLHSREVFDSRRRKFQL